MTFDLDELTQELNVPVAQLHRDTHHLFEFIGVADAWCQNGPCQDQPDIPHPCVRAGRFGFSGRIDKQICQDLTLICSFGLFSRTRSSFSECSELSVDPFDLLHTGLQHQPDAFYRIRAEPISDLSEDLIKRPPQFD
jgi:hypothetical protein